MIIPISDLLKIEDIDNYNFTFNRNDPAVSAIFSISSGNIYKTYSVTKEYLYTLLKRGVVKVSINTTRDSMDLLKNISPSSFIKATGEKPVNELFILSNEYGIMNLRSKKKRRVTILEDVYSSEIDVSRGEKNLLIEYGTVLDSKVLSRVKKDINPVQKVFYKDSEEGVLIFIPDAKEFKLKVDLIAIIVNLDLELLDSKTLYEAIEIYKTKSPKLVILGNLGADINSKMVLLELEEWDPYIKKLNYDKSPASNRQFETERIRSYYFSGYAKMLETEKNEKEILPDEIKNNLIESIQKLDASYVYDNYIEIAYTLKQFGRMFNITSLWNMLQNVKNRHSNA